MGGVPVSKTCEQRDVVHDLQSTAREKRKAEARGSDRESGQHRAERLRDAPYRTVIATAPARSAAGTIETTCACLAGTSICDSANLARSNAAAVPKLGLNGTSSRRTFAGVMEDYLNLSVEKLVP